MNTRALLVCDNEHVKSSHWIKQMCDDEHAKSSHRMKTYVTMSMLYRVTAETMKSLGINEVLAEVFEGLPALLKRMERANAGQRQSNLQRRGGIVCKTLSRDCLQDPPRGCLHDTFKGLFARPDQEIVCKTMPKDCLQDPTKGLFARPCQGIVCKTLPRDT